MDIAFKFEKLLNLIFGKPDYVTFSEYWENKYERSSLLFTSCLILSDKEKDSRNQNKLIYYMENLFLDDTNKTISIECMEFLISLKK